MTVGLRFNPLAVFWLHCVSFAASIVLLGAMGFQPCVRACVSTSSASSLRANHQQVGSLKLVPLRALRFCCVIANETFASHNVDARGHLFQVSWIRALSVSAQVVELQSMDKRSRKEQITQAMNRPIIVQDSHATIASFADMCAPFPTRIGISVRVHPLSKLATRCAGKFYSDSRNWHSVATYLLTQTRAT